MSVNPAPAPGRGRSIGHRLAALFRRQPPQPGEQYGAPGQGNNLPISVLTVVSLLVVWWLFTNLGYVRPIFLPAPEAVAGKFVAVWQEEFSDAKLAEHTLASLYRIFSAFFFSCVAAIPIGILMAVNRIARGVFDPPIEFYRPIPPLAYLPLIVIWFGIGELAKVLLLFLSIFAPIVMNTRAGVRSVSIEQIHAAYAQGATRRQVVWHVILKGALPEILTGMRIGMGIGWTTLVAAEMIAATEGLGFMVLVAADFLVTDVVIMGILVIGAIALTFDVFLRYMEHLLVPWKGKM